jgi:hypothetical protein
VREIWKKVDLFPDYSVSNYGEVRNDRKGVLRRPSRNQQGLPTINLRKDGSLYCRSLSVLVARTFIEPDEERFDTVISLNGDRFNCRVDNLLWRPRPFAIRYHWQLEQEFFQKRTRPVAVIQTGERFGDVSEAAMAYGLIHAHIQISCIEQTPVFPTDQIFVW